MRSEGKGARFPDPPTLRLRFPPAAALSFFITGRWATDESMRFPIAILIGLLAVSCKPKPIAPPDVTRTEFHWPGATAEELAEIVRSVAPGFSVAIIDDEHAEVFHQIAERQVDYELGLTAASRPDQNFAISGPDTLPGGIPALPTIRKVPTITMEADAERLAHYGLTLHAIRQAVSDAGIDFDSDPKSAELLSAVHITGPAGEQVKARDVVTLNEELRERPLIIDRR